MSDSFSHRFTVGEDDHRARRPVRGAAELDEGRRGPGVRRTRPSSTSTSTTSWTCVGRTRVRRSESQRGRSPPRRSGSSASPRAASRRLARARLLHVLAGLRIERRRTARRAAITSGSVARSGAGKGDSLAHAARQHLGQRLLDPLQAHQVDVAGYPPRGSFAFGHRLPLEGGGRRRCSSPRSSPGRIAYCSNTQATPCIGPGDLRAVDLDQAGLGLEEAGDKIERASDLPQPLGTRPPLTNSPGAGHAEVDAVEHLERARVHDRSQAYISEADSLHGRVSHRAPAPASAGTCPWPAAPIRSMTTAEMPISRCRAQTSSIRKKFARRPGSSPRPRLAATARRPRRWPSGTQRATRTATKICGTVEAVTTTRRNSSSWVGGTECTSRTNVHRSIDRGTLSSITITAGRTPRTRSERRAGLADCRARRSHGFSASSSSARKKLGQRVEHVAHDREPGRARSRRAPLPCEHDQRSRSAAQHAGRAGCRAASPSLGAAVAPVDAGAWKTRSRRAAYGGSSSELAGPDHALVERDASERQEHPSYRDRRRRGAP